MKSKFILLFLLIVSFSFPQKKDITLDDIFLSNKFTPEKVENVRWQARRLSFCLYQDQSG